MSAVVTSYYDVAVRNIHWTLEHYHTPGVHNSKSMTAEYDVTANDVPSMVFTIKVFRSASFVAILIFNTRSGRQERREDILCINAGLIFKFCEKGRSFRGMSICSIFSFLLSSIHTANYVYIYIYIYSYTINKKYS